MFDHFYSQESPVGQVFEDRMFLHAIYFILNFIYIAHTVY